MRTAIYGAGAMGTVLGAYIAKSGKPVDLISRNVEHITALKNEGATVCGEVEFKQKVNALFPEEMSGKYDIIFLMTKQSENRKICQFLKDYLADDGVICTTQNGLPEQSVAEVVGEKRTLGCAVSWGATFLGKGASKLTSSKDKLTFSLGSPYGENQKIESVKEILESMGKVETPSNFVGSRWAKIAINAAFSSISAATGLTFGQVAKDKTAKRFALNLLNEIFDLAERVGVKIDKIQGHDIVKLLSNRGGIKRAFALTILPIAMKNHSDIVSGMYYDLKKGRKCDIGSINGALIDIAQKNGIILKYNNEIVRIIGEIEGKKLELSPKNVALLKEKNGNFVLPVQRR